MNKLESIVRQTLSEAAKIKFAGHSFILKVDTNEDPQKKGVKVQFLPTEFGSITATEQNDIAIDKSKCGFFRFCANAVEINKSQATLCNS